MVRLGYNGATVKNLNEYKNIDNLNNSGRAIYFSLSDIKFKIYLKIFSKFFRLILEIT